VKQELPTLSEHMSLPPVFSGVRVKQELKIPFGSTWVHSQLSGGSVLLVFLVFCVFVAVGLLLIRHPPCYTHSQNVLDRVNDCCLTHDR
jgi:hypothetical protein